MSTVNPSVPPLSSAQQGSISPTRTPRRLQPGTSQVNLAKAPSKSRLSPQHKGQVDVVTQFATFEEYLDSNINPKDLYYLENESLARQLVELGCRGANEILTREEFLERKRAAENVRSQKHGVPRKLASSGKMLKNFPLLQALADREDSVRNGKLMCIVFLRDRNRIGQEISGYIDYAWRLKTENFEQYFEQRKRLLPKPSDLSFFNWDTQSPSSNHTPNFQVIAGDKGLMFKNKRDRKIINVDPETPPGENSATKRITIKTSEYLQAVIFDHLTRQKI